MKDLRESQKHLESEIKSLRQEIKEYSKFTDTFLKKCNKAGIKKVGIGKVLDESWPFGSRGSVFTDGKIRGKTNWPAIWGVVEEMGISGGCGNGGQHQVSSEAKLLEGIYELKDGKWLRTD